MHCLRKGQGFSTECCLSEEQFGPEQELGRLQVIGNLCEEYLVVTYRLITISFTPFD